jgi:ankyrin repeat protein
MWPKAPIVALCLIVAAPVAASEIANAARDGKKEAVRLLLAAKADVNEPQGDGTTALHWAAYNDDRELADLLIRAGASVDAVTRNGALTPLMVGATNGSSAVVQALLAAGANARARATDGATPLMTAAASGSAEAVGLLLDHGADVNATDHARGQTPLMFAAAANRAAVVSLLLKHGASVAQTSKLVPVSRSGYREDTAAARPRQQKPDPLAGIKAERRTGATAMGGFSALHFAAREGQLDAARALVDAGADLNQPSGADKSTPLVMAASNGHFELAKLLLDKGADPNAANEDGLTPLYAAIETQFAPTSWSPTRPTEQEKVTYLDLMKVLLGRGAEPNARLKKKLWFRPSDHDDVWVGTVGTTAYWRAAFANDVDAMRLLVTSGADPNIASSEGNTPLMAAAGLGWTANLHRTVATSRIPAIKLCLELGADLNATDVFKYTALHAAAYRGDKELVAFLVDQGARLDVKTIFGTSVTDMANGFVAYSSLPRTHPETVQLLMKLGAPAPSPERQGESAYCNARALNCPIAEAP